MRRILRNLKKKTNQGENKLNNARATSKNNQPSSSEETANKTEEKPYTIEDYNNSIYNSNNATRRHQTRTSGQKRQSDVSCCPQPKKRDLRRREPKQNNAKNDTGYNSDDERGNTVKSLYNAMAAIEQGDTKYDEDAWEARLSAEKNYALYRVAMDGNCLFRAVADQIYGDEGMHDEVRRLCMDYMEKERDHYSQFVTQEFEAYINRKRQNKCFGNNLELQALSEMYNRPIEIHCYDIEPINIFQDQYNTDDPPMRLSYHAGNHYNSIRDLTNPSVGVGLGLPNLQPGMVADQVAVEAVKESSERDHIDDMVMSDVVRDSEKENIEEQLFQQILQSSAKEARANDTSDWELQQAAIQQSMEEYYKSMYTN
mmetsp:Transcript_9665/g.10700  ORF Transcript_9665/g.10700 Transcript_9665/m.10700 type:complete len:370 (+) Transcript_9665:49-1158(+)